MQELMEEAQGWRAPAPPRQKDAVSGSSHTLGSLPTVPRPGRGALPARLPGTVGSPSQAGKHQARRVTNMPK